MSSIESSIALMEAEKRDLYGRLKALDDAIATLRKIAADIAPDDLERPRGKRRADTTPVRIEPRGKPRGGKKPRRRYSDEEKRDGAALAHRIGIGPASRELGVTYAAVQYWMAQFPEDQPEAPPAPTAAGNEAGATSASIEASPDAGAALELPATLRLVNKLGRRQCSCGVPLDDDDAWRRHNDRLHPDDYANHRLEVVADA